MVSVGFQMLNMNCNLADVAHSLDKNLLKTGETKDEMAKLNRQVWDVKNELGKVNNNLINITRSLDALNATQRANGGRLNSLLETVVTSQKILANCIANQTQAFKEMRASRDDQHKTKDRKAEGNTRKRSHDRRGVSPLRALNGFDTLHSDEKRRRIMMKTDYQGDTEKALILIGLNICCFFFQGNFPAVIVDINFIVVIYFSGPYIFCIIFFTWYYFKFVII